MEILEQSLSENMKIMFFDFYSYLFYFESFIFLKKKNCTPEVTEFVRSLEILSSITKRCFKEEKVVSIVSFEDFVEESSFNYFLCFFKSRFITFFTDAIFCMLHRQKKKLQTKIPKPTVHIHKYLTERNFLVDMLE